MFEIKSLQKKFGNQTVFENFDLKIPQGQFVSILGPSGCGKSTLIRMIAGLDPADRGTFHFPESPRVGFVFQEPQLLPWLTALENIILPLKLKKESGMTPQKMSKWGESYLEGVGLRDQGYKFPHMLSGGMKMRVSLARALISQPNLLILDEPFSALDEETRFQLQQSLHEIWFQRRITTLLVTHSTYEAVFLSERILVLSHTEGKIRKECEESITELRTQEFRDSQPFLEKVRGLRNL